MAAKDALQTGLDDDVLLERYRRDGDLDALDVIVERYRRPLFALIYRTSGNKDADDMIQEVWLRVLKNPYSFRGGNFAGWLFRIARNLVIDRFRKRREINVTDMMSDGGVPLTEFLASNDAGPNECLVRSEELERLQQVLDELPVEQREVFIMRTQGGLKFRDIAMAQGCSINTTLARMRYALDRIHGRMRHLELEGDNENRQV